MMRSRSSMFWWVVLAIILLQGFTFLYHEQTILSTSLSAVTSFYRQDYEESISCSTTRIIEQRQEEEEGQGQGQQRRDPEDVGSWIGDQWIPPLGWRLYSPTEMKDMLQNQSILLIGDSLCRRFMATMYQIVNASNLNDIPRFNLESPHIIDVNRKDRLEPCHRWKDHPIMGSSSSSSSTNTTASKSTYYKDLEVKVCRYVPGTDPHKARYWDFMSARCYRHISMLIEKDKHTNYSVTSHYNLIIIAMGEWEASGQYYKCLQNPKRTDLFPQISYQTLNETLQVVHELSSPNRPVIWRLNGYNENMVRGDIYTAMYEQIRQHFSSSSSRRRQRRRRQQEEEEEQQQQHDQNVHLLDWNKAIVPRSTDQRIKGDVIGHYGYEARLQLIQMLMNLLVEQEILVVPPPPPPQTTTTHDIR